MRAPLRVRAGAAALAALLALACGRRGEQAREAAPEPPEVTLAPDNVAVVEERTLRAGPQISGTLRARREAAIRAEVAGAVLEVLAEAGERVRPGQTLARIDDTALRQSVLAARSAVTAARNALRVAESDAARARTLAQAGAASMQQAEQAEATVVAGSAQVADAEARLALAAEQAGKARVRAPFTGIVGSRQVSAGDVVAPGAPLFTVVDPSRLQFEASIPAARLGEVRPGAPVDFCVTGFADRSFAGEIERISPAVDAATGQVRVYVDVPNADGQLLSGLYAQGRVAHRSAVALAAPSAAVDEATSPPSVVRIADGRAERVAVELGLRDEVAGAVALTAGVAAGDVLVLGAARDALVEGARVRVAGAQSPAAARRAGGPE